MPCPEKLSFKNGEIKSFFKYTKTERICHYHIRNTKVSPLNWKDTREQCKFIQRNENHQ